jgi:hypothetical protein
MLFDPFTDEAHSLIIENIENIVNFDPRLEVLEVVPTSYEHGIQIIITLKYIPTNQVEDMLYTFNQEASQVTSSVVLDNNNSGSETTGASGSGY